MLHIKIITFQGNYCNLTLNDCATLSDLKSEFQGVIGFHPTSQHLIFHNEYLDEDDKLLTDYGIIDNSTIYQVKTKFYKSQQIN